MITKEFRSKSTFKVLSLSFWLVQNPSFSERFPTSGNDTHVALLINLLVMNAVFYLLFLPFRPVIWSFFCYDNIVDMTFS